jgi:predicted esterase
MAVRGRLSLCAAAALTLLACRSRPAPLPERAELSSAPPSTVERSAAPLPSAATERAPGLLPLQGAPLVTLKVPGFGDAVVSVPLGATTPRALALALHGNFDRPEWQCDVWRRITRGEVFVLCPRGVPRKDVPKELDRWEWSSQAKTKAELVAAIAALRARYPEHVRSGPIVFTGFSLGAILGAGLIQDPALHVGAAVFVEGGYKGWTPSKAKGLAPRVRRVLFACGQTDCRNAYRYQLATLFERAGLSSSVVADVKAGHTYDDPLAALVQAEWPTILSAIETE